MTKIDAGHVDPLVQRVLRIIDAQKMACQPQGADVRTIVAFRLHQVEVTWVGRLLCEAPLESVDVPVLPSWDIGALRSGGDSRDGEKRRCGKGYGQPGKSLNFHRSLLREYLKTPKSGFTLDRYLAFGNKRTPLAFHRYGQLLLAP